MDFNFIKMFKFPSTVIEVKLSFISKLGDEIYDWIEALSYRISFYSKLLYYAQ